MNEEYTQREWDRIVGIGNPPHEYGSCGHEYMEGGCPQCGEQDQEFFNKKLKRGLRIPDET
jgi:hypothetical protein